MVRIHKISFYAIDHSDDFDSAEDYFYENIDGLKYGGFTVPTELKMGNEFEFDDGLVINQIDCSLDEYDKYFKTRV